MSEHVSRVWQHRRISFIASILFYIWAFLDVRGTQLQFDHLSIEDGLSQNTVFCILQDSRGFLWFGTEDGLNRYDGYCFKVFKTDPQDSLSLSSNIVLCLYEDQEETIWVGTIGGGLNRFIREKETFIRYRLDESCKDRIGNNNVYVITEDESGRLWIGTDRGLRTIDREGTKFTYRLSDAEVPDGLNTSSILAIHNDGLGQMWIGTQYRGLFRYTPEENKFSRYLLPSYANDRDGVGAIYENRRGMLLVGTSGEGLYAIDPASSRCSRFYFTTDGPDRVDHNTIRCIWEDATGRLWLGTDRGLKILNPVNGEYVCHEHDPNNANSLSQDIVLSIFQDRSGIIWIGNEQGGINRLLSARTVFFHYQHDHTNNKSLCSNSVRTFYEDASGFIWVGTKRGVNVFDRKKNEFARFVHNFEYPRSLECDEIRAIHEDEHGTYYFGTQYNGFRTFNKRTNDWIHFKHNPQNANSLSSNKVKFIHEDQEGLFWIGTDGGGLNKYDNRTKSFIHYRHDPFDPHSLSSDRVCTIHEDCDEPGKILWIGTFGGGFNKFDKKTENFIRFQNIPNNNNSLSYDYCMSIHQDRHGILWIGTYGGGFNRFDPTMGTFQHYREQDGLANNTVYGILEDEKGMLWLSTNRGISRFDPAQGTFKNYDKKDGLQSNEFNGGAYFKGRDGMMYFGGINGFNVFHPDSVIDNQNVPQIVIIDFQLFNRSVPIENKDDAILHASITETKSITLSYKHRVFSFEFAALEYTFPKNNEYAYRMNGFEDEWNYVGNRRFATYTNLASGDYEFRVKGSNSDGIWNEEGTSVHIFVKPPFYQTVWFRVLSIVSILCTFVVISKVRTQRMTKRNVQLEKMNIRLHEEIDERKRAEEIQAASYRIAVAALTNENLKDVFEAIHDIIGKLMSVKNFYIALYDDESDLLSFPYFVDEYDEKPDSYKFGKGLTEYVIRTGQSLLATPDVFKELIQRGDVERVGPPSVDWLGVPLKIKNKTLGVMATQNYMKENRIGEREKHIFMFVSTQVAMAIERKMAEDQIKMDLKEKEILLKEIHHRVKNNLQVISSLLSLQSQNVGNKELSDMLRESQARVRSMAIVHEKLYGSEDFIHIDFAGYVQSLLESLFVVYEFDRSKIDTSVSVDSVSMDINLAIPCGLIINELISNSMKHAFPDPYNGHGKIDVMIRSSDKDEIELIVKDTGIGIPKSIDLRQPNSLGLKLVKILVEDQLSGTLKLDVSDGTKFNITFKK